MEVNTQHLIMFATLPRSTTRTPKEIAQQACKAAKEAGLIADYSVRAGGRATIYFAPDSDRDGKTYTTSALDTLAVLSEEGFRP